MLSCLVKRDNRDIANLEARINETMQQISDVKNELESFEDAGAIEKYRELRQKEETINNFLTEFETGREQDKEQLQSTGEEIDMLVGKLSRCLSHINSLKSSENTSDTDGADKNSLEALQDEKRKLELDLSKIDQLEEKINVELDLHQSKIKSLETDIEMYSDIPKLKASIEEKAESLKAEKDNLTTTITEMTAFNEKTETQLNTLKANIEKNDAYKQIRSLESKLSEILSTNEAFLSTIKSYNNTNLKIQVLDDIKKYNQKLLGY